MCFSVLTKIRKFPIVLFFAELVVFVPVLFACAAPSPSFLDVGMIGERMAPLAMCFACVDGRWCIRSNCVFSFRDKFEMIRIDTNRIFANRVVNAPLSVFGTFGDGSFSPREQYPVDKMFDSTVGHAPTVLAFSASPYPATRFGVYPDFGEYALVFVGGKLNREILDFTHVIYSFAVDGVVRVDAARKHCIDSFSIPRTKVLENTPSWFWIKE